MSLRVYTDPLFFVYSQKRLFVGTSDIIDTLVKEQKYKNKGWSGWHESITLAEIMKEHREGYCYVVLKCNIRRSARK